MKILIAGLLLFGLNLTVFARSFDNLTPAQRKAFAADWLETGKAYFTSHKKIKAKNCYLYANELYPMGKDAEEARTLLKDNFKITVNYNPETQFKAYAKRADGAANETYKLNNLLMALEIKSDKDILHKTAVLYNSLGDKDKASGYLKKALDAGLSPDSVDPSLKDLNK